MCNVYRVFHLNSTTFTPQVEQHKLHSRSMGCLSKTLLRLCCTHSSFLFFFNLVQFLKNSNSRTKNCKYLHVRSLKVKKICPMFFSDRLLKICNWKPKALKTSIIVYKISPVTKLSHFKGIRQVLKNANSNQIKKLFIRPSTFPERENIGIQQSLQRG